MTEILKKNIEPIVECIDELVGANIGKPRKLLELAALKVVLCEHTNQEKEWHIEGLTCFVADDILFSKENISLLNKYGFRVFTCHDYDYETRIEFMSYMIVAPDGEIPNIGTDNETFYADWSEMKSD